MSIDQEISPGGSTRVSNISYDIIDNGSSFLSSKANTLETANSGEFDRFVADFQTNVKFWRDLGEFFDLRFGGEVDPVQQRLGNLKLNGKN